MSWQACKCVWDEFRPGGALKLTLLALADYGSRNGDSIYPSMRALAAKIGISEAQTRRYVGRLVKMGAIECVRNLYGGKPGATRHYRINFDRLTGCEHATRRGGRSAPRVVRDGLQSCAETGCVDARDGLHTSAETGCVDATQTESEPKVNRKRTERGRKTAPLPLDFSPSLADCEWAKGELQSRGIDAGDFHAWHRDVLAKFDKHCRVSGKRSKDWPGEWRLWVLREFGYLSNAKVRVGRTKRSFQDLSGMDYGEPGAV